MKNLSALFLSMLFLHIVNAQTKDLEKVQSTLKKYLVGQKFLGGMYDPPCYNIVSVQVSANGEIILEGSEKGCNRTFFIKEARISTEEYKVTLYQATPRINISFYTENAAILAKAFTDLKNILINSGMEAPEKKEIKENKPVTPEGNDKDGLIQVRTDAAEKKYSPLFSSYPLSMLESKTTEPGLFASAMKETQSNPDVKKTTRKVGNTNGIAFLYYKKTTQVAELFFNENEKFYYYNLVLAMEYLDGVNEALTNKGFSVETVKQENGTIENTWKKKGYPYFFRIQYITNQKRMSMAILDNNILK